VVMVNPRPTWGWGRGAFGSDRGGRGARGRWGMAWFRQGGAPRGGQGGFLPQQGGRGPAPMHQGGHPPPPLPPPPPQAPTPPQVRQLVVLPTQDPPQITQDSVLIQHPLEL
jgi:hypothetical protein